MGKKTYQICRKKIIFIYFYLKRKKIRVILVSILFAIAFWSGLYQDFIKPLYVKLFTLNEVSSLPHISYEYNSNYPHHYFRLQQENYSKILESNLRITNNSEYDILSFKARFYLLRSEIDLNNFLDIYNLTPTEYNYVGVYKSHFLRRNEHIDINLIDILLDFFNDKKILKSFLLPEPGQYLQKVVKINSHRKSSNQVFPDEMSSSGKKFAQLSIGIDDKYSRGFSGSILKIVIEYEIGEIVLKHLLLGGMYYMYANVDGNILPLRVAISGFTKADNSFWAKSHKQNFKEKFLKQHVIDRTETDGFVKSKGSRLTPNTEVTVVMYPGAVEYKSLDLIPLPLYIQAENKFGK